MPDGPRIATQGNLPDPGTGVSAKRELVNESTAKDAVDQSQNISWDMAEELIETLDPFVRTMGMATTIGTGPIDGYGIELSFGGELQAFGGVEVTPIGLCLLWITNSESGARKNNPHYFLFGSSAVKTGASVTASVGVEKANFLAHRWGGGKNTAKSFAGPSVAYGAEASAKALAGAGLGASYWSSANYSDPKPTGVATFSWPNDGWEGASFELSVDTGAGFTFNIIHGQGDHNTSLEEHMNSVETWVNDTAESAYNTAQNLDRDQLGERVAEKTKNTGEITNEGEGNYQEDVSGWAFQMLLKSLGAGG